MSNLTGERQQSVSQRTHIIDAAIAMFRARDYAGCVLADVAEEAGIPLAEVEQHFPDWDSVVVATIDRWNGDRMFALQSVADEHGAVAFLRATVAGNVEDPALVRLLMATFSAGSRPTHPASEYYRQQYALYYGFLKQSLERDVAAGREHWNMDPARGAEQLLAMSEGLTLQSMLRDFDLVEAYDRATARLRYGWCEPYVAQPEDGIWEL